MAYQSVNPNDGKLLKRFDCLSDAQHDAGAPVGAYTNRFISHEQSDRVIDDPRIKGVALTGSVAAGRIDRPGSFMQTTILTDIAPGNLAFRDEFLGPELARLDELRTQLTAGEAVARAADFPKALA